jgi:glyoxylase-like metal-dependent hydrolase (beta-lactamase superfamily II)
MDESAPRIDRYGPVSLLVSPSGGRYPEGNSLLVEGEREVAIIDPSLGVLAHRDVLPKVDRILLSHCHEDHIAGNSLFPNVPVHLHSEDAQGLDSLDAMMEIYGFDPAIDTAFRKLMVEKFNWRERAADVVTWDEGDELDLGGVQVRVLHSPGHTRGHCCLEIRWDDAGETRRLLYLGDIELTSFGPYYGDAWSSLVDFEVSLSRIRKIEADWYATFHHIGVLAGRQAFLERLDRFEAMIGQREARLLAFICEPRSMAEIVAHRFVYRPADPVPFADPVERRSMGQHLDRLIEAGSVRKLEDGRFVAGE